MKLLSELNFPREKSHPVIHHLQENQRNPEKKQKSLTDPKKYNQSKHNMLVPLII